MKDSEDIIPYEQLSRLDILYGKIEYPMFACDKCNKKECRGTGKCKAFGAWSYGLRIS